MTDMSVAQDKRTNPSFRKRWVESLAIHQEFGYPRASFEMACWGLLKATERLHTHGISCFGIFDQGTLNKAAKEAGLTFEQRIQVMCDYMRLSKKRVDSIMKGDGIETFVAVAEGKLKDSGLTAMAQTASAPSVPLAPSVRSAPYTAPQKDTEGEEQPVPGPMPDVAVNEVLGVYLGEDGWPRASVAFQQQLLDRHKPCRLLGNGPGIGHFENVQLRIDPMGEEDVFEPETLLSRKRTLRAAQLNEEDEEDKEDDNFGRVSKRAK